MSLQWCFGDSLSFVVQKVSNEDIHYAILLVGSKNDPSIEASGFTVQMIDLTIHAKLMLAMIVYQVATQLTLFQVC